VPGNKKGETRAQKCHSQRKDLPVIGVAEDRSATAYGGQVDHARIRQNGVKPLLVVKEEDEKHEVFALDKKISTT
jgi:hypothetical protein